MAPDHFPPGDATDVLFLLFLGPMEHDGRAYKAYPRIIPSWGMGIHTFILEDDLHHNRSVLPAIFLGPGHSEPTPVSQFISG